jgi:peptidoglycan/xylan/chitin deacetylase (PgdA/CDA1 family)
MYHEVHAADAADDVEAGAAVYHVSRAAFVEHLEAIRDSGLPVRTVGEWLNGDVGDHVALTFDDGWQGALTTGVRCLADAGLRATFFVTRDLVGQRHYADGATLREAHAAGMELGTHGVTHRFLADLSEGEIRAELADSKAFLEDLLGEPVETGSVPGGAWSPAVARIARECGYRALCTSRPGINDAGTDPMGLRRVAVRRGTSAATLARYARGSVGREVARATALELPRRVLGRERYAALRERVLRPFRG